MEAIDIQLGDAHHVKGNKGNDEDDEIEKIILAHEEDLREKDLKPEVF